MQINKDQLLTIKNALVMGKSCANQLNATFTEARLQRQIDVIEVMLAENAAKLINVEDLACDYPFTGAFIN